MQAAGFYLVKPFILLIAILPFRVIHILSDLLFPLLWHIVRYRKRVVMINLRHSFPERSEEERLEIARKFYRYFLDMTLETFKEHTISKKEVLRRVRIVNPELIQDIVEKYGSHILLLPHFNNWEYIGPRLSMQSLFVFRPIYKPLNNKYFDRMMYNVRSRFGAEPIEIGHVLREMIKDKSRTVMTVFVSDQKPIGDRILWVNFLNQRTAAFRGGYLIAQKLDQPLIYMHLRRPSRGYYEIEFELLTATPKEFSLQELAEMFFDRLEKDIRKEPQYWLWSHQRWKRGINHIYNTDLPGGVPSVTGGQQ